MSSSAFDLLLVPVLLGMLGGFVAGAGILALTNAAVALFGGLGRAIQSVKASPRPARVSHCRVPRPVVRGDGSIG
jgi:hypothetical protein